MANHKSRVNLKSMHTTAQYLESLSSLPGIFAEFVTRIPDVEVFTDRDLTLNRLRPYHESVVNNMGFTWDQLHLAEQIHGSSIKDVSTCKSGGKIWKGVDGLISSSARVLLGIYVADCGAVYIADSENGAIALLHSGKKGTEANITGKAISLMCNTFGSHPENLHIVLAPCIRPPFYEVDFASTIKEQVVDAGVPLTHFTDSNICTGANTHEFYSYRMEKGKTGRMLALLGKTY